MCSGAQFTGKLSDRKRARVAGKSALLRHVAQRLPDTEYRPRTVVAQSSALMRDSVSLFTVRSCPPQHTSTVLESCSRLILGTGTGLGSIFTILRW